MIVNIFLVLGRYTELDDSDLTCIAGSACNHGEIRLLGRQYIGIAELCVNGLWAAISDVVDQAAVAKTFCRQLIGEQSCKF